MTKLKKPVRRISDEWVREQGKLRPIVVSVYPGDVIGFRLMGTRREERTTIRACRDLAIKLRVRSEKREKKAAKEARRGRKR